MDHARNNLFLVLLLLGSFMSCSRKPEEQVIKLLEEKYANLYINNETHKREVIKELEEYLQKKPIDDNNIEEIRQILHRINDGHVVIFDGRKEKNLRFQSGINFVKGAYEVRSCPTCSPAIPEDKYEIIGIDGLSLSEYLKKNHNTVAGSTEWGRNYRLVRLLEESTSSKPLAIKLKSTTGKVLSTTLNWTPSKMQYNPCVSSERLKNNVYKLNIHNLWCDEGKDNVSREGVYENFKRQFDEATAGITDNDRIVIDLRENGGGGDLEVEYTVNAFIEKPVMLYHYKYLRKTHPGKRKWIEKFWPFRLSLWSQDEYDYTRPIHRPKKTFYNAKIITMISHGCFSSCESIASVLKEEKRTALVGSKTHGGAGDPVIFPLGETPYSINLPTCITWQYKDHFYEGEGVMPQIVSEQNPKSKEDTVLKLAIDQVLKDKQ